MFGWPQNRPQNDRYHVPGLSVPEYDVIWRHGAGLYFKPLSLPNPPFTLKELVVGIVVHDGSFIFPMLYRFFKDGKAFYTVRGTVYPLVCGILNH